ncbi:FmdB family zinc ribbon protein [Candidimonas nitroreducens]|uniref:Putative regulatory protein FmdB zinc ribbon domain-containing protein n=1 Tax=Candidimonas nitroreducens TaxID=683354 RepID=A0A225ML84_9BURK|nr:zinc ribbon domain-containing protein [Candidimonas nitroreducens]OWT62014.1 hypothetical protein CEY11_09415 [Candidimonas nitroreducens]
MPMYTVRCHACGKYDTIFRRIAERDANLPQCHGAMHRIIEAPTVQADLPGYQSPIDGHWVEGRRQRTEDLRRNHCRPWEGMAAEKQEAHRRAAEADKAYGAAVESAIVDTYRNMSPAKQRALEGLAS